LLLLLLLLRGIFAIHLPVFLRCKPFVFGEETESPLLGLFGQFLARFIELGNDFALTLSVIVGVL
jgi:hypothetical protein